jgi:RimJ/RimL family protein N-acetyltransferase
MEPSSFSQIETPRLRLRRFTDADLPTFFAYRNDPEIARYQSWERISLEGAQAFIDEQKLERLGAPGSWFQFAIELKATAAHIGDCMLHVRADEPREGEIGYTLARSYHRQGFASEAVRAVLDYAFETLGLQRITASVDCANTPSVALLERVGMRRERHLIQHTWFKGRLCDEYLYAILRDEWLRRPGD